MDKPETMADANDRKDYLVRNEVWDEDYWLCAMNIANKLAEDVRTGDDYDGCKYARRRIMALCEVYADVKLKAVTNGQN